MPQVTGVTMQDAIQVAIVSFGAVVGIVLIFAAVLGLRSFIDTRRRAKARAQADAQAWSTLLSNQLAIAPAQVADAEAAAALERARKLHDSATETLKTAKKTKQFRRVRTYALAGLHNSRPGATQFFYSSSQLDVQPSLLER